MTRAQGMSHLNTHAQGMSHLNTTHNAHAHAQGVLASCGQLPACCCTHLEQCSLIHIEHTTVNNVLGVVQAKADLLAAAAQQQPDTGRGRQEATESQSYTHAASNTQAELVEGGAQQQQGMWSCQERETAAVHVCT